MNLHHAAGYTAVFLTLLILATCIAPVGAALAHVAGGAGW